MLARLPRVVGRQCVSRNQLSFLARTLPLCAEHVIDVPSMGDSITEGTLIAIEKQVGEFVEQDEIIAVIETDKINVEIRSSHAGTITEFFPAAELNKDVEVGVSLFKIESDGAAPASSPPASDVPIPVAAPIPPAEPVPVKSPDGHRKPSIQFLGHDGWAARKLKQSTTTPLHQTTAAFDQLPFEAAFLMTEVSLEEMEAVELGFTEIFL